MMKKNLLKTFAVMILALAAASCCCNQNKGCKVACEGECTCESMAVCQKGCVEDCKCPCATACAKACDFAVYNPNEEINLIEMPLFFESDKAEVVQVNPNTTRKMVYLNDLMMTIVEIKGPMAEPDPFHSHKAEQICYIAEGRVIVTIGDQSRQLKAGDIFAVPADVPHTVQALDEKLVLVDAFNPIRQDFLKK